MVQFPSLFNLFYWKSSPLFYLLFCLFFPSAGGFFLPARRHQISRPDPFGPGGLFASPCQSLCSPAGDGGRRAGKHIRQFQPTPGSNFHNPSPFSAELANAFCQMNGNFLNIRQLCHVFSCNLSHIVSIVNCFIFRGCVFLRQKCRAKACIF